MSQPTTASECLRLMFQATLDGDYARRDRLAERCVKLIDAEDHAARVERALAVDFYVTARGQVVPTKTMAMAAGEIH